MEEPLGKVNYIFFDFTYLLKISYQSFSDFSQCAFNKITLYSYTANNYVLIF